MHERPHQSRAKRSSVTVSLPGALVDLFPGSHRTVEMHAESVDEMIDALDGLWPGMAARIRDSRPGVRRHINIFVDGARVGLNAQLAPGAEVFVLIAISGG